MQFRRSPRWSEEPLALRMKIAPTYRSSQDGRAHGDPLGLRRPIRDQFDLFCCTPSITRGAGSAPSPGVDRFRRGPTIIGEPVQPGLAARGHRPSEGNGEVDGPETACSPRATVTGSWG